jgi:NIPSNAP
MKYEIAPAGAGAPCEENDPKIVCPIVELRQYTLHPGQRDALIELFDNHFVEPQQAAGMTIIGEFRVVEDPNRFVWLRGFPNMAARRASLEAFYTGPVWRRHAAAANATMVDSDNVLLLRPQSPPEGFPLGPERGAQPATGQLVLTIYHPEREPGKDFCDLFASQIEPLVADAGATVIASLVSIESENDFPGLPVRKVHSFAWFARLPDARSYERYAEAIATDPLWARTREAFARLGNYVPPEVWRLEPTRRSRL